MEGRWRATWRARVRPHPTHHLPPLSPSGGLLPQLGRLGRVEWQVPGRRAALHPVRGVHAAHAGWVDAGASQYCARTRLASTRPTRRPPAHRAHHPTHLTRPPTHLTHPPTSPAHPPHPPTHLTRPPLGATQGRSLRSPPAWPAAPTCTTTTRAAPTTRSTLSSPTTASPCTTWVRLKGRVVNRGCGGGWQGVRGGGRDVGADRSAHAPTHPNPPTLLAAVAYNEKHNDANGEGNRDGTNDNFSWNCGVEGPTDNGGEGGRRGGACVCWGFAAARASVHARRRAPAPSTRAHALTHAHPAHARPPSAAVLALRQRQMRNMHMVLMLSQGVPMLLAGEGHSHEACVCGACLGARGCEPGRAMAPAARHAPAAPPPTSHTCKRTRSAQATSTSSPGRATTTGTATTRS